MEDVSVSREIVRALGAFVLIAVLVVLVLLGPVGWLVAGAIGLAALVLWRTVGSASVVPATGINCPGCGGRLDAGAIACDRCGREV